MGFLVMCFRVLELNDLFCTWGFLYDFHWAVFGVLVVCSGSH